MVKKCPECGSLNVEEVFENEAYCKDCFLHCATSDMEDASVFDQITQSPSVLAEEFVESTMDGTMFYSILTKGDYCTRESAIAATLEELNKLAKPKEGTA